MESKISDQWKMGGDCSICRKRKYCTKDCTQHKAWVRRAIAAAFGRTKAGRMMNAMKKTMTDMGHETEYMDG